MDMNKQQSGLGIAGMIIGIVSFILSCLVFGGFIGIIGLILSIIALSQKGRKIGMAIAGVVLNTLAIFIMIIMILVNLAPASNTAPSSNTNIQVNEEISLDDGYATLDKFNQIKTGMTYEEVVEIMGSEGTIMSETEVMDIKTTLYYWYAKNKISNMNIMVQDGEVISKAQLGLE